MLVKIQTPIEIVKEPSRIEVLEKEIQELTELLGDTMMGGDL